MHCGLESWLLDEASTLLQKCELVLLVCDGLLTTHVMRSHLMSQRGLLASLVTTLSMTQFGAILPRLCQNNLWRHNRRGFRRSELCCCCDAVSEDVQILVLQPTRRQLTGFFLNKVYTTFCHRLWPRRFCVCIAPLVEAHTRNRTTHITS